MMASAPKPWERQWSVPTKTETPPVPSGVEDFLRSLPTGAVKGVSAVAGLPGDIRGYVNQGMDWLLGPTPEEKAKMAQYDSPIAAPSTQQVQGAAESVTGPLYQP